uniref:CCHC-type domain-containing protein n=1 Tax=Aegilops tauschii subsp. strangulata TaxID=200361 RepID=A0A453D9G6_AEGTS
NQPQAAPPMTTAPPPPPPPPAVQVLDPKYKDMICFNCSWLGHYVGNCVEPKKCFICVGSHNVNNCAAWAKPLPAATYFGSAASGLGFYHIEVPGRLNLVGLTIRIVLFLRWLEERFLPRNC